MVELQKAVQNAQRVKIINKISVILNHKRYPNEAGIGCQWKRNPFNHTENIYMEINYDSKLYNA